MYQRIHVNHLERRARRFELLRTRAGQLTGRVAQQRANPLAAAEHRVAHGFVQFGGRDARTRQIMLQRRFHAVETRAHPLIEIHKSSPLSAAVPAP